MKTTLTKHHLVYIAKVAMLAVIASLLTLLDFPLPFAPSFYKLDFSELAVLLAGFSLGPIAGVLTELIKILLNLLMNGTATAFVGETANFAIGVAFVLPASIIYKRKKTFKRAVIGLAVGTATLTLAGALLNYFVLIPAYEKFMNFPLDAIIGMGTKINPAINSLRTLILFATVPFNLIKGVADSLLTMLVYKRLSPILHLQPKQKNDNSTAD